MIDSTKWFFRHIITATFSEEVSLHTVKMAHSVKVVVFTVYKKDSFWKSGGFTLCKKDSFWKSGGFTLCKKDHFEEISGFYTL